MPQSSIDELGREKRFRRSGDEIVCAGCGHAWAVAVIKENYFFVCPICRTVGNLPGVLAAEADRDVLALPEGEEREKEREKRIKEIKEKFPHPQPLPVVPTPKRFQNS